MSVDKQSVIRWLERINYLDELIRAKKAEEELLMGVSSKCDFDGMPHSGGASDVVGNNTIRLLEIERERIILEDQRKDMLDTLKLLPAQQFGVLHREYVQKMKRKHVAEDMGYCEVQIWRIKQDALKSLGDILENKKEIG